MSIPDTLRVILPAKSIPEGSTVTKPSGIKRYVLRDAIRVWTQSPVGMHVEEDSAHAFIQSEGVRYLFAENGGDIIAVTDSILLTWMVEANRLRRWLNEEK